MTTTDQPTHTAAAPGTDRRAAWMRLLLWSAAVSAVVDVAVMALAGTLIPPVAAGVALSIVGIALLRSRPRAAIGLLGVVSALLLVTSAPFATPHLAHPESGVDFGHAAIHLGGRLVAVMAAIGAWRQATPPVARWLGRVAAALLAVVALSSLVAIARTTNDAAGPGDVTVAVRDFAFPAEVRVRSGGAVLVDNADLNRHTFTVRGEGLTHDLPARSATRFTVDLAPGTYEVFCAIPGHDAMTAPLIVE